MDHLLLLHPDDNVLITKVPIPKDAVIQLMGEFSVSQSDVPKYFKVAARNIGQGNRIIKYGMCIGIATRDIAAGEMVHVHNMKSEYMNSFTENK